MKLVIRSHGHNSARANRVRKEDLRPGIHPDLTVCQAWKVGINVINDAVDGAGQSDAADEKDEKHDVGRSGRDVDHFGAGLSALPNNKVAHDPRQDQTQRQFPNNRAHIVDSRG